MSKKLLLEQIEKIIKENNPNQLIGATETSYFEFRETAYLIEDKSSVMWVKYKARIELLKDFSSIANNGGGYIFIGLKPKHIENRQGEYVEKISGIEKNSIDIERWLDILSDGLIPRFPRNSVEYGFIGESDQVFWVRIRGAKNIGCFPLIIPLDQWNPEEKIIIKGQVYGIYTRDGAKNIQLINPHKFQEYISSVLLGKVSASGIETQINRLSNLMDRLEGNISTSSIQQPTDEQKKRTIKELINKLDSDADVFYMVALPTGDINIKEFWDKSDNSLYYHLKNPPILRSMGWDLSIASIEYPQPEGDGWEAMNGYRKILKVSKNGFITAGANIPEFLDWGLRENSESSGKKLLNAFAFVEYINSFFLFIKQLIDKQIISNNKISYNFELGFILKGGEKYSLVFTVGNFIHRTYGPLEKEKWQYGPFKTSDLVNSTKVAGTVIQDIFASGFKYVPDFQEESYLQKVNGEVVVNEALYKKQK